MADRIILASRSKARRRLLRQIGLKFIATESRARESRRIRTTCADLVVDNALKKARDAAKRYREGIVIGADTVVLAGNKIIGKPRTLTDAFNALKTLSARPQWVYTGVAVVDAATGRVLTAYEKTKVYMYPLTDREIHEYFKKISPFDKAGSFDVQGPGSIFIDRIEGCFYNVVGLPVAKMAKLLMKFGVKVF